MGEEIILYYQWENDFSRCCTKCHFISPNCSWYLEKKGWTSSKSNKHYVEVCCMLVSNKDVGIEDDDVDECVDDDDNRK